MIHGKCLKSNFNVPSKVKYFPVKIEKNNLYIKY